MARDLVRRKIFYRWNGMMRRCYDPKFLSYKNYGARGIYVCDEWKTFDNYYQWFLGTHTPGLTMDRIDNNGPYSPANVRWATRKTQAQNQRKTQLKRDTAIKNIKKGALISVAKRHAIWGDPKTRKEKRCPNCEKVLLLERFPIHKRDGHGTYCLDCVPILKKKAYQRDIEKMREKNRSPERRAYMRARRLANIEKCREYERMKAREYRAKKQPKVGAVL